MTPPTVREQTRTANRERALDQVLAAAGDDADCRSAGIEVVDRLGNFPVLVNGTRTTVTGLVQLLRSRWIVRENVSAGTDDPVGDA